MKEIGSDWDTPRLHYPDLKVGRAEIKHKIHKGGYYLMEGVGGYDYWRSRKPFKFTTLSIGGREWMTDEPINVLGMKMLAEKSAGRVLVGGLGLGMVAKFLSENPKVSQITIVERDSDVIRLISPLVKHPKIKVVESEFGRFVAEAGKEGKAYDTVIIDIWVGKSNLHTWAEMMGMYEFCKSFWANARIYIWGTKNPKLNPAVKLPATK